MHCLNVIIVLLFYRKTTTNFSIIHLDIICLIYDDMQRHTADAELQSAPRGHCACSQAQPYIKVTPSIYGHDGHKSILFNSYDVIIVLASAVHILKLERYRED